MIGPKCEISSISSVTHTISIACDEKVRFNEIEDNDLEISISGPLSPYQLEYTINSTTGYVVNSTGYSFRIQLKFLSSLLGNDQESILITINNQRIIQDMDNNNLETTTMQRQIPFQLIVLSPEEKAQANSQSSYSIISLILTFGTSIFIQVVLGGAIEATWLLLGTLQLMSLLPLLNLNLPANFRQFSKNLAVLNGEPEALPNLFEYYYETLNTDKEPYNYYFELMNFKTEYLLLNSGRKIEIWFCVFLLSGITWFFVDICRNLNKFGRIAIKIDTKMRYGIIIRAVSQSYVSMVLSTCLNVYTISWSGQNVNVISNLIALGGAVIMLNIPLAAFNIIHKTSDLNNTEFQKRYKTFIADLRTKNPY